MRTFAIAIMLCLSAALTAQAGAKGMVLSAGGNNGQVYVGAGYLFEKAEAGIRFGWTDRLDNGGEAVKLTAYALINAIKDVNVPLDLPQLGKLSLKATGYIGGEAGGFASLEGPTDYSPCINGLVGLALWEDGVGVRVEYSLPVTKSQWSEVENSDGQKVVLGLMIAL